MTEIYVAEFTYGDEHYVAAGTDPTLLPVYENSERRLERTRMTYPGCLRFMLGADVLEPKPRILTPTEWRERFDLVLGVNG